MKLPIRGMTNLQFHLNTNFLRILTHFLKLQRRKKPLPKQASKSWEECLLTDRRYLPFTHGVLLQSKKQHKKSNLLILFTTFVIVRGRRPQAKRSAAAAWSLLDITSSPREKKGNLSHHHQHHHHPQQHQWAVSRKFRWVGGWLGCSLQGTCRWFGLSYSNRTYLMKFPRRSHIPKNIFVWFVPHCSAQRVTCSI